MKAQKRIFTKEQVAAMPLEEKVHYTFVDKNNNVAGLIPASEYPSVKAHAASKGLTSGKTAKQIALQPLADAVRKNAQPDYTKEEIECRMEFDDATCKRYFKGSGNAGDSDNLSNFQKRDPEAYRRLKISAISRGYKISAPRPVVHQKQEPESDGKFTLNADIAHKASLPEGVRVDAAQFEMILRLVNAKEQSND